MTSDEATQAASFAYAYKLAEKNPLIKGFIVHRTIDNLYEKIQTRLPADCTTVMQMVLRPHPR